MQDRGSRLDRVYSLRDKEEMRDFYDDWSGDYDAQLAQNGYATPARIAEAAARLLDDPEAPVLDFGCGTGLCGAALIQRGFRQIDGCDLSERMLAQARTNVPYRDLWVSDGSDLSARGPWSSITACGVISKGAAPAALFDPLLDALVPGGHLLFSFNGHTLEDETYTTKLRLIVESGRAEEVFREDGPHLPEIGLRSTVIALRIRP